MQTCLDNNVGVQSNLLAHFCMKLEVSADPIAVLNVALTEALQAPGMRVTNQHRLPTTRTGLEAQGPRHSWY